MNLFLSTWKHPERVFHRWDPRRVCPTRRNHHLTLQPVFRRKSHRWSHRLNHHFTLRINPRLDQHLIPRVFISTFAVTEWPANNLFIRLSMSWPLESTSSHAVRKAFESTNFNAHSKAKPAIIIAALAWIVAIATYLSRLNPLPIDSIIYIIAYDTASTAVPTGFTGAVTIISHTQWTLALPPQPLSQTSIIWLLQLTISDELLPHSTNPSIPYFCPSTTSFMSPQPT